MPSPVGGDARTKIVCRKRLAGRGDIVVGTFDRQQRRVFDGTAIDDRILPSQLAAAQSAVVEDDANILQERFLRQIHQRRIKLQKRKPTLLKWLAAANCNLAFLSK